MLVKTATANRVPSTRCSARACDETSIATTDAPALPNDRSCAWRSGASGVVREPVSVPMTPHRTPSSDSRCCTNVTVVVFPFVPVTPTTATSPDG